MTEPRNLDTVIKEAVLEAVNKTKTASAAALALGVSRATLYRMMKKYGIQRGGSNE